MKKKFPNVFPNDIYIIAKQIEKVKGQLKLEEVLKDFLPIDLDGLEIGKMSGKKISEYKSVGVIELLREGRKAGNYIKEVDLKKREVVQHLELYGNKFYPIHNKLID